MLTLSTTSRHNTRPCVFRSSGTSAMPCRIAVRAAQGHRPTVHSDLPAVEPISAEDKAGQLRASAAHHASNAHDLAFPHGATLFTAPRRLRPWMSNATSPIGRVSLTTMPDRSRPTIMLINSRAEVSAIWRVPTTCPS